MVGEGSPAQMSIYLTWAGGEGARLPLRRAGAVKKLSEWSCPCLAHACRVFRQQSQNTSHIKNCLKAEMLLLLVLFNAVMRKCSDVNLKAIQHVTKGASARAALKQ